LDKQSCTSHVRPRAVPEGLIDAGTYDRRIVLGDAEDPIEQSKDYSSLFACDAIHTIAFIQSP
jgi:hypothetical protein